MDLHYKISQWPSQDASDKDKRIAELEKLVGDSERRWASELNERVYKIAELERKLADADKDAERKAKQIVENLVTLVLDELDEPNRVRKAVVRLMNKSFAAMAKGE